MKKVLVTGATGFIGSYIIDELLQQSCNIIATSSNHDKAVKHQWFQKVIYKEFDFESFDDTINYYDFFDRPDLLIHLSWQGLPNYTEGFHINTNLPLHASFLKNMIRNGLADITVTGTCLEYGMMQGELREDMAAVPTIAYAIAKNELRIMLESWKNEYNFRLTWVRLFYMYGKGQNPKSLISQLEQALDNNEPIFNMSGGEQVRDFLPVTKVAKYIVALALSEKATGIINCCSGRPVKLKDFVRNYLHDRNKTLRLILGFYKYTEYEPMEFWGSNQKLQSLINLD